MKKIPLTEEELHDLKVKLKPVGGINPEQYIKTVYLVLVLALFFLIFFLPGLLKNGTWYSFTSSPPGASVYADETRLGATPGRYFVPRGMRTITVKTPYTTVWSDRIKVRGRIFGTLFFKRNKDMHITLNSSLTSASLDELHREAAAWFSTDEGYSAIPLPPVLPDMMKSVYRSADREAAQVSDEEVKLLLLSLLRTASEDNAYRQWLEGYGIYATGGASLNPGTLLKAAAAAADFLKENPRMLEFLKTYHKLPDLDLQPAAKAPLLEIRPEGAELRPLADESLIFVPVGRVLRDGKNIWIYAADREITKGVYSLFLQENPGWGLSGKQSLINRGLVDENYLADWQPDVDYEESLEPLNYISLPAAMAFCDWLDKRVYPEDSRTVRLPDEWEWEEIALANGQDSRQRPSQKNMGPLEAASIPGGALDLYDMNGNLWEWCHNGFGTNDPFLYNSLSMISRYDAQMPRFAVRGGSWANAPGEVLPETRGSQPARWCTPYIGFRPILLVER